jgi:CRISPR type III-B/RAMP module-associated protein Cmr3
MEFYDSSILSETMSSEIKTYRFILTPLDKIFFGGEKSPFKEEYFQYSRQLPQQTTILGFLRYEILKRTSALNDPLKEKWSSLIGDNSFNSTSQNFGSIKKISPVSVYSTIQKSDLFLFRNPCQLRPVSLPSVKINFGENDSQYLGFNYFEKKDNQGKIIRYDPKNHSHFGEVYTDFANYYKLADCNKDETVFENHGLDIPCKNEGVFYKDIRPGITKNYSGDPKDESYYKMHNWRMMPDYAYSFIAQFDDQFVFSQWKEPSIVRFGGDSSLFRLQVVDGTWPDLQSEGNVLVLISDGYVNNSIYDFCNVIVSETIPFRNLKTSISDKVFTKRPVLKWHREPGGDGRNTDPAKVLLKRGSILVAKENKIKELEKEFENDAFKNIGYNYYKNLKEIPNGL